MRNHRSILSLSILLTLVALPALAQYDPPFPPEEFAARRAAFYKAIGDDIAVVLGALEPATYSGFRQANNLEYLTGVETEDAILLMDGKSKRATLFVPTLTARALVRTGPHLQPGEDAAKMTGLDNVMDLNDFTRQILSIVTWRSMTGSVKVLISAVPPEIPAADSAFTNFMHAQVPWDSRLTRYQQFAKWLRDRAPQVEIGSYTPMIAELRQIKSPREIEMMRKAAHLTAMAENEAIRATRPGRYEYEVSAAAEFVMKAGGAQRLAWDNIVASGKNMTNWHYGRNSMQMKAGDLVLADIGAEYNYYDADLTRTWPVSGRFTAEQRKMYDCLLDAQKKTIAAVKPGVTVGELTKIMKGVFEKHGYGDIALNYIGHLVGMAAHDMGNPWAGLKAGMVFNVEPILEIPDKGIHMRLEDSVLVTENGHEVLTKESPMEVEEIYKLYDEGSKLFGSEDSQ